MNPSNTDPRACQARRHALHQAARRRANELREQAIAELFGRLAATGRRLAARWGRAA